MRNKPVHILFTRSISQSLIDTAKQHGIEITATPFIHTTTTISGATTALLSRLSREAAAAVFTSANAVAAVAGFAATAPWTVYCTSGATAKAVRQQLPGCTIAAVADTATDLAQQILLHNNSNEIYFFCGDKYLPQLPAILSAGGIQVNTHVVYATTLTPTAVTQSYDAIVFYSPSAVDSFLSLNTIPAGTVLFAVGPTTAAGLAGMPHNIITSSFPGTEALLNTINDFYNMRQLPS